MHDPCGTCDDDINPSMYVHAPDLLFETWLGGVGPSIVVKSPHFLLLYVDSRIINHA